jgi:hypothetical protein
MGFLRGLIGLAVLRRLFGGSRRRYRGRRRGGLFQALIGQRLLARGRGW